MSLAQPATSFLRLTGDSVKDNAIHPRTLWIASCLLTLGLLVGCDSTSIDDFDVANLQVDDSSLSDEQIRAAVAIALAEPNVWPELNHHPHEVVEVRQARNGHDLVVIARFDEIVPPEAWPPDEAVCAIGGHTGQITGMVWIVRPAHDRVMAFSPEWQADDGDGYVTCVS